MKTFFREILAVIILAVVITLLLHTTIQTAVVITSSMESTLQVGQRLLINKVAYKFHEPERGDIIVFLPPDNSEVLYIKRIIGLPGDTIEIKMRAVYVNGSKLDEPYISEPPAYTFPRYEIPENNYFLLGDNRNNSSDSHTGWTLPRQNIIGKAWLSTWPPDKWGLAPNYPLQEQLAGAISK